MTEFMRRDGEHGEGSGRRTCASDGEPDVDARCIDGGLPLRHHQPLRL